MVATPRIFIAEDDIDNWVLLEEAFKDNKLRYDFRFFKDGEKLIQTILKEKITPDIILSDIYMPMKGGFEILTELKLHEQYKEIPIIIFSSSKNREHVDKAYELGALFYVMKPDTYEELVDVIGTINGLFERRAKWSTKKTKTVISGQE